MREVLAVGAPRSVNPRVFEVAARRSGVGTVPVPLARNPDQGDVDHRLYPL